MFSMSVTRMIPLSAVPVRERVENAKQAGYRRHDEGALR